MPQDYISLPSCLEMLGKLSPFYLLCYLLKVAVRCACVYSAMPALLCKSADVAPAARNESACVYVWQYTYLPTNLRVVPLSEPKSGLCATEHECA